MKLKRQLIFIVGICITVILTACTTAKVDNMLSLTDIGLRLINEVDTLAECEEYTSLYSANEEISNVIKGISMQRATSQVHYVQVLIWVKAVAHWNIPIGFRNKDWK